MIPRSSRSLTRRTVLKWGSAAAVSPVAGVLGLAATTGGRNAVPVAAIPAQQGPFPELEELTVADLQAVMTARQLTARQLSEMYLARIEALDRNGPRLNTVIEVNPDALAIADALDRERAEGRPRGPLHGIPVLLKDNIDTADQMLTTAGSLALVGSRPRQDATVAARLREAGAVILGKTNMTEWAGMRSYRAASGWSGRGG